MSDDVIIHILGSEDAHLFTRVAPDVFDEPVHPRWSAEFLADPRHHMAVALDAETIVGMASGVRYVHPDKAPELFVNEVAVAPTHHGRGIGTRLMHALLSDARARGCVTAWVLTSPTNTVARRLYARAGGHEEAESPTMFLFSLAEEPA
jgi:ribosomal protein S18 acetylase RimI-like enzyme